MLEKKSKKPTPPGATPSTGAHGSAAGSQAGPRVVPRRFTESRRNRHDWLEAPAEEMVVDHALVSVAVCVRSPANAAKQSAVILCQERGTQGHRPVLVLQDRHRQVYCEECKMTFADMPCCKHVTLFRQAQARLGEDAASPSAALHSCDTCDAASNTPRSFSFEVDRKTGLSVQHTWSVRTMMVDDELILLERVQRGNGWRCHKCTNGRACQHARAAEPMERPWAKRTESEWSFDLQRGKQGEWVHATGDACLSNYWVPPYTFVAMTGRVGLAVGCADDFALRKLGEFNRKKDAAICFEALEPCCACASEPQEVLVYIMGVAPAVVCVQVCSRTECTQRVYGRPLMGPSQDDNNGANAAVGRNMKGIDELLGFYIGRVRNGKAFGIALQTVQAVFVEVCNGSRTIELLYRDFTSKLQLAPGHQVTDSDGVYCRVELQQASAKGPLGRVLAGLWRERPDWKPRYAWAPQSCSRSSLLLCPPLQGSQAECTSLLL